MVSWCVGGGVLCVGRVGFVGSFFVRMPRHFRMEIMMPIFGLGSAAWAAEVFVFLRVCALRKQMLIWGRDAVVGEVIGDNVVVLDKERRLGVQNVEIG